MHISEHHSLIYRPTFSSWAVLILPVSPILLIGALAAAEGGYVEGLVSVAFVAAIVGYNGTAHLVLQEGKLTFRRYGREVWSACLEGLSVDSGSGGQPAVLPAWIFKQDGRMVGYLLKLWFAPADIDQIKAEIQRANAPTR